MPFKFRGGIQLVYPKPTMNKAIEELDPPSEIILPLLMHKGTVCSPVVKVGDYVKIGQKVGDSSSPMSAPIFSSVSGTVTEIAPRLHPSGEEVLSVVIKNDFKDECVEVLPVHDRFRSLDAEELARIARDAGIVGLGGSAYPLSEKILNSSGKVDTLIINGAECEPYISADNRIMIEYTEEMYAGATVLAHALGIKNIWLAVQSDKAGAIAELRRFLAKKPGIKLCVLHTRYPHGAEKQLIEFVTGRQVPPEGMAYDAAVITINVSTAVALARAAGEGAALTTRVVTVAGRAVANPKNLLVRIGTPINDLFKGCGGFLEHPDKIIMGGPMMGNSVSSLEVPVIKGTNGLLAFCRGEGESKPQTDCIHCGKCVGVCPMNLMPFWIHRAYKFGKLSECVEHNVSDCIECGSCAYVCPARLSLVAEFRTIKKKLSENSLETVEEKADEN